VSGSRPHPLLLAALACGALGLALHAAHAGLGLWPERDGLVDTWLYHGLMLGAAAAVLARGIADRADRAAWLILGAGALAWSSGDLWFTLVLGDEAVPPLPSVSDGLFLSFYPAAWIGLGLLVKRHVSEFPLSLRLDAVMGALAVGALAVTLLHDALRIDLGGDTAAVLTTLAYPVGDVLVLALVTALLALTGWRPGRTWALIGAALVLGAAGDGLFLAQAAQGTYAEGTLLDSIWPASLLLLAVAAWQRPRFDEVPLHGLRILAMPACFALIAMSLFVAGQFSPLDPVALALACGTIVVLIARMAVTLQENLRMVEASRGEALTDQLTGLGNRRRLMADLEAELAAATPEAPRTLVMFDLDGFKAYNDGFGHLAGDALLARVGAKLRSAVTAHGTAYRPGGDEFCVLLRTRPEAVETVVAVAAEALHERGDGFELDTSYGVATLPADAATPAAALELADRRMYAHKATRSPRRDPVARGTGLRRSLAVAAAAAGLLVLPAAAPAAVGVEGGVIQYKSGPLQFNNVTTTDDGTRWGFNDFLLPIASVGECTSSQGEGYCPKAGVTAMTISTLDWDDKVTVSVALPATIDGGTHDDTLQGGELDDVLIGGPGEDVLRGGAGADRFLARDGEADTIDCGTGADVVEADPIDTLTNCPVAPAVLETVAPPAPSPAQPGSPAVPPALVAKVATLARAVVNVSGGVAPLDLGCPATVVGGCRGVAYLDPVKVVKKAAKRRGKSRSRRVTARAARRGRTGSFGRGSFVIAAGKQGKVKVRLTTAARRALGLLTGKRARAARRGRRIKAVVTVRQRGQRAQRTVIHLRG
jgi:diguanylate cyclase (GGDEF)-like protein